MFPERYSVLVVGSPNAGLFEFSTYLAAFYLRNHQSVIYVEADSSGMLVKRQLRSYGVKHEDFDGISLEMIDCSNESSSVEDPEHVADPSDLQGLLGRIEHYAANLDSPVRIIVNSLSTLHVYSAKQRVEDFLKLLSDAAKKTGSLTITLHLKMHPPKQIDSLSELCDGLIEMRIDQDLSRHVRISKMKGMRLDQKWVPFDIEPVEPTDGAMLIRLKKR